MALYRFNIEKEILELLQGYCKKEDLVLSELLRTYLYDLLRNDGIDIDRYITIGTTRKGPHGHDGHATIDKQLDGHATISELDGHATISNNNMAMLLQPSSEEDSYMAMLLSEEGYFL